MQPVLLVVGTRPEGIKMLPIYFALKEAEIPVVLCSTGQHNTLLQEVFDNCNVMPDYALAIMKQDQDLSYITCSVLEKIKKVYEAVNPTCVLVQGDTTTVMAAALAAFYQKIPIGHVEAGLRTGDLLNPYPEEANRKLVSTLAYFHFTPTDQATNNLLQEGYKKESIFCTGNTVVDALVSIQNKIKNKTVLIRQKLLDACFQNNKKLVLLTVHRRESFPEGIVEILSAVKTYALEHPDTIFIYPHHPNPTVIQAIKKINLQMISNVIIFSPLLYHELVYVMTHVNLVMTDSGGIQEEAVSLGKTVLVLRDKSERMEGVWHGLAHLVGTKKSLIMTMLAQHLAVEKTESSKNNSLYGDGHAAEKIVAIIRKHFYMQPKESLKAFNNIRIQI